MNAPQLQTITTMNDPNQDLEDVANFAMFIVVSALGLITLTIAGITLWIILN